MQNTQLFSSSTVRLNFVTVKIVVCSSERTSVCRPVMRVFHLRAKAGRPLSVNTMRRRSGTNLTRRTVPTPTTLDSSWHRAPPLQSNKGCPYRCGKSGVGLSSAECFKRTATGR